MVRERSDVWHKKNGGEEVIINTLHARLRSYQSGLEPRLERWKGDWSVYLVEQALDRQSEEDYSPAGHGNMVNHALGMMEQSVERVV